MAEWTVENWIRRALAEVWSGAEPGSIAAVKGDASGRRFWRVGIAGASRHAPQTAIAVDLGPDDLPLYAKALGLLSEPLAEPPFVNVQRFLRSLGAAVPELYHAEARARMLLVEDVGELTLSTTAAQRPDQAADLYRQAIDELLLLHCEGTRRTDRTCFAFRIAYDARLFRWELEQFVELGLPAATPASDRAAMAAELDRLAAELGVLPRVFSHRDYHGHNLFVRDGKIRMLDFQDALMAPHAQDLAVLLTTRDTSRVITPAKEERLLHYYFAALQRRRASELRASEFMRSYWHCVLQHALKVIGRFARLERQGQSGYARYLPYAAEQARRALQSVDDFPAIGRVLEQGNSTL